MLPNVKERMGEPIDVPYAALYLASDKAKYITGTELTIDGGILASSGAPLKIINNRKKPMNWIEKLTMNLIGSGKVGKGLAKRIILHQCGAIQALCNATLQSAKQAVAYLGQGYAATIDELSPAQITLITTPDDQIAQCCRQLAQTKTLVYGAYVIHCSGAWNTDILTPAQQQGAFVASVYPYKASFWRDFTAI